MVQGNLMGNKWLEIDLSGSYQFDGRFVAKVIADSTAQILFVSHQIYEGNLGAMPPNRNIDDHAGLFDGWDQRIEHCIDCGSFIGDIGTSAVGKFLDFIDDDNFCWSNYVVRDTGVGGGFTTNLGQFRDNSGDAFSLGYRRSQQANWAGSTDQSETACFGTSTAKGVIGDGQGVD